MLQRDAISSRYYIRSYAEDSLQILSTTLESNHEQQQQSYSSPLLLSQDSLQTNNLPQKFDDITSEIFSRIQQLDIEILIIGTGSRQKFPAHEVMKKATEYNFSIDYMDTGAASRTFNILANENRRVAALLFIH